MKGFILELSEINNGDHQQTLFLTWDKIQGDITHLTGHGLDIFGKSQIEGKMSLKNGAIAWNQTI